MLEKLFTNYSISEIFIFLIIICLSIKELITFIDWLKGQSKKIVDKNKEKERVDKIEKQQQENIEQLKDIMKSIKILIDSDKDDIKSWITDKHHYFCYEQKYIDDYSLDCIEKRYAHYIDEGGNHFIHQLMDEIRALPRVSNIE